MSQAPVELSQYNPKWPKLFQEEIFFLLDIIADYNEGGVEHIGSTAVPGLTAKPVIDIMFGVKSLEESRPCIEILSNSRYCYYPYKEDVMHWFCKPSDKFRTHHLHLVPYQSPLWIERIAFRDALRNNCEIAAEYEELKITLAEKYKNDREQYTEAKWPFIKKILDQSCHI